VVGGRYIRVGVFSCGVARRANRPSGVLISGEEYIKYLHDNLSIANGNNVLDGGVIIFFEIDTVSGAFEEKKT